jgi:hypothetical protein
MDTRIFAIAAILALPATALGADREISFEVGTLGQAAEDNWFLFSEKDTLTTVGLRLGYPIHDRLAVVAGWHHGARGTHVSTGEYYEDEYYYYDEEDEEPGSLAAAYWADDFTLGLKADWDVAVWFRPYATVGFASQLTTVRLDDDTSVDDNPNQIERRAFSPGALGAAGLDFRVPFAQGRMAAASYLELGYQVLSPADLEELGKLQARGLVFRWGIGMRF